MNITLPEGFTARPSSLDEIPAAVDFFNAWSKHYLGIEDHQISSYEAEWTIPKFKPDTDARMVYNPAGEMIGYIEVWTIENPPVHPWVWFRVHPEYEGLGIGEWLLEWGEARARRALPNCPGELRVAYRCGVHSQIEAPKQLMENFGMRIIRHYFRMLVELAAPPPTPVWPAGITVRRPDDPEAEIEAIYRADNEAFRDHFGYVEQPFEDGFSEFRHWFLNNDEIHDSTMWHLAMDGDKIAGIALCIKRDPEDEECGHIDSLAVLRPYRRRGLGLALLQHAFGEYYRRGYKRVSLGVDAQNLTGALSLYKRAGMQISRQFDMYEKELRPGKEISVKSLT
ncbi:MAG: GNAT family N-acetyltransferase [Anaerolineae bacterium]|nr:GNAT family N-acetyltransferase [Anaerolineae bacterium]MBL6966030.1 GNAT family N-acetyltransferase [Anaerolineales bacterium]